MSTLVINSHTDQVSLEGVLTVDTVAESLLAQVFTGASSLTVDLSQLTRIDTAGLAWLVLMFKQANHTQTNVKLVHPSDALTNLAKLSDVDKLLGL